MKRNIVFVTSMIFLFGQIPLIVLVNMYFNFGLKTAVVIAGLWGSAILCGWFSYWAKIYLSRTKKEN